MRARHKLNVVPDFASLHPGYVCNVRFLQPEAGTVTGAA